MVWLKIRRQNGERVRYDLFHVDEIPGMSVLEALFQVQERQDGGLCFRYSCRGAVCGSCAMSINGIPRLACRTQVADAASEFVLNAVSTGLLARPAARLAHGEILIEPLPNLKVIRDMVVDMDHFYELLDYIKPWIDAKKELSDEGHLMNPATEAVIETYMNCIMCAVCHGSCPAAARDETYLGPAALARAWRYHLDPRETDDHKLSRLRRVDSSSGVWGCDTVYKCTAICPRQVKPTQAITALRRQILKKKITGKLRRAKDED